MATETHGAEGAYQAVSSCVDSNGSAIGMPQLCIEWFPNQMLWLVVTLVVIYLVLSRIALPRIAAILAERQGTIANDVSAAEELQRKAEAAEAAYTKALADARAEAQNIAAQARAEINADLDKAIAEADAAISARAAESEKSIAEIRANALQAVEVVAKEAAADIVAAFGGSADADAVSAAVDSQLKG